MKKITLLALFALLGSTVYTSVNAQASFHAIKRFKDPTTASAVKPKSSESLVMKSELNFKILKRFGKKFSAVQDESWVKTPSGFLVRFKDYKGASTTAYLDRSGYCTASIRYYDEKLLPPEVRNQVKSTYFDYSIIGVKEVNSTNPLNEFKAYLVIIDDATTRKIIRVIDGAMDEYESFTKM